MILTAKQRAVFDYICLYQSTRSKPPTVREMMEHFLWRSTRSVAVYLDVLERKGYIRRYPGEVRNIEIVHARVQLR